MKCPMRSSVKLFADSKPVIEPADCLKEKCAWWIPAFKACSVYEIAIRSGQAADHLFQITEVFAK